MPAQMIHYYVVALQFTRGFPLVYIVWSISAMGRITFVRANDQLTPKGAVEPKYLLSEWQTLNISSLAISAKVVICFSTSEYG